MEIYDIIHGNIKICPIAKRIIDTDEFQRLRNIKQLGCCNYIFPSATHTRFEHSIGVYYLAGKYISILSSKIDRCFSEVEKKCIKIAALIHDLGHGPYSHLFDEIFEDKNHEYRSIEIFKYMNKKYNFGFLDVELKLIYCMIDPKQIDLSNNPRKYIYQIVSNINGIDVDRFDYIVRDIKMTGLNYGIEYERIMNHSNIINGEILFSEKVKTNIDDFFRTRFIMYKDIYNHRTVRGIEFMMKEYIRTFDEVFNITDIIKNENWKIFTRLNDGIINLSFMRKDLINESKVEASKKLDKIMDDIHRRRIYKSVGEIITDSKINIDGYDRNNLIIDTVKISYYGNENCKFIQERNILNKSLTIVNNTKYITSVYYKSEKHKTDAEKLFEQLRNI
jgi:HD superfamily phosphohydrolase